MEIDEIEYKVAQGEMTAMQVFTQMKQHIKPETPKERKLFETENYLITMVLRLTGDMPRGLGTEVYFISEDIKEALKNIGTKRARSFVKDIENAKLQERFSNTHGARPIRAARSFD